MPPGVIGDPHATPKCSAADFADLTLPAGDPGRRRHDQHQRRTAGHPGFGVIADLQPGTAPGRGRPDRLQLPARCTSRSSRRSTRAPRATTASTWRPNTSPTSCRSPSSKSVSGASRPLRPTTPSACRPVGTRSSKARRPPTPSNAPEKPFLSNPTTCNQEGLTAHAHRHLLRHRRHPRRHPFPATTGCDQLSFNPSLFAQPTGTATDSPSGLDVDLQVPQQSSPKVPSPSEIRATTVTLPDGFTINPNAADGKTACSDEEALIGTRLEAQCPEDSKVGTLERRTARRCRDRYRATSTSERRCPATATG